MNGVGDMYGMSGTDDVNGIGSVSGIGAVSGGKRTHDANGLAVPPSESLIIRPMRRADYRTVAELIRQAWYADDDADGCAIDHAGNHTGNHAGNDTARGGRARHGKFRPDRKLAVSQRLAAIDAEECLSRTTHAAVAEYEGHVAGVILGSIQGRTVPGQRLRHRMRQMRVGLPLLGSVEGVRGLCGQLALACVDRKLLHDAGLGKRSERVERAEEVGEAKETNRAEIVLFIVSPEMRGKGVGRRLFDHMLSYFRAIGAGGYFLFTDSSCNVGFYEHNGLKRKASRTLAVDGGTEADTLGCFLYEGSVPEQR